MRASVRAASVDIAVQTPSPPARIQDHTRAFLLLPHGLAARAAGQEAAHGAIKTTSSRPLEQSRTRILAALKVDLLVCVEDPGNKLAVTQGASPETAPG